MPHHHIARNRLIWAYVLVVAVAVIGFGWQEHQTQQGISDNARQACASVRYVRGQFNRLLPARRVSLNIDAEFIKAAAVARQQTAEAEARTRPDLAAIDRAASAHYRRLAQTKLALIAALKPVPPVRCDS